MKMTCPCGETVIAKRGVVAPPTHANVEFPIYRNKDGDHVCGLCDLLQTEVNAFTGLVEYFCNRGCHVLGLKDGSPVPCAECPLKGN